MIIIDYIDYYNLFGGHFHLGVYSRLWAEVYTLMAVCWVILSGQQIYTVIQAVLSLLYIVATCHFFSAVTWKDIITYLQKMWGVYSLLWDTVHACVKCKKM